MSFWTPSLRHPLITITGHGACLTTESETLPIRVLLIPRAPCYPSLSDRPLDPRLGGRSPVLPLPSQDGTVPPSHLPTVVVSPPRRAPPWRAVGDPPPGSVQVPLPPSGRWFLGKAERSRRRQRRG